VTTIERAEVVSMASSVTVVGNVDISDGTVEEGDRIPKREGEGGMSPAARHSEYINSVGEVDA
jgi:hypothetical protein